MPTYEKKMNKFYIDNYQQFTNVKNVLALCWYKLCCIVNHQTKGESIMKTENLKKMAAIRDRLLDKYLLAIDREDWTTAQVLFGSLRNLEEGIGLALGLETRRGEK